jgi:type II secretory pathway pseudopilin PulG
MKFSLQTWIRIIAALVIVATVVAIIAAWRAEQRNRRELAAELAGTKQALADAAARQRDRDAKLADTLAALAAEKRAVQSPQQIIQALPKHLALPVPITLQPVAASGNPHQPGVHVTETATPSGPGHKAMADDSTQTASGASTTGTAANPFQAVDGNVQAVIPEQDLKPLYDFTVDCEACAAKLKAAQGDLADEQGKSKALTLERDDALRIARGGSVWRRIGRASKWLLIGAAAGALAARSAH